MSSKSSMYAQPYHEAQPAVLPVMPTELPDQLVKGPMTIEAVEDAFRALKKALIERALGAEMHVTNVE